MEYPLLDNTDLPLVLLGGTLCNARLWQPLIERLNISAVLCITLTGAESAPQASRRLLKVLPPRFLLAGFSLGAIVALQMAADAPERVNGLTLISVNPLPVAPDTLASRREAVHTAQARARRLAGLLAVAELCRPVTSVRSDPARDYLPNGARVRH